MTADQIIATLELEPHPEGGLFRETYRATETISRAVLPSRFRGERIFISASPWSSWKSHPTVD